MTITGQNYDEVTQIKVDGDGGTVVLYLKEDPIFYDISLSPEGAIKVAHALIEAAEEIIKK